MTTFHIVEDGYPLSYSKAFAYNLENAKQYAKDMREKTGKGYYIAKVETVFEIEPMTEEEIADACG